MRIIQKIKSKKNIFYKNNIFYPFQVIKKILFIGIDIALYKSINKAVYLRRIKMKVGLLKDIKDGEFRTIMTPNEAADWFL